MLAKGMTRRRTITTRSASLLLLVACTAGCHWGRKKEPQPVAAPTADVTARHFAGTALSGELGRPLDPKVAARAWPVKARVFAVTHLPDEGFEGIGPSARLVLADGPGQLMAPSARLVYSTSFRKLDPAQPIEPLLGLSGTWAEMPSLEGAVAEGTTLALDIVRRDEITTFPQRLRLSFQLFRTEGAEGETAYQLAIVSDDRILPPDAPPPVGTDPLVAATQPAPPPEQTRPHDVRETVVVPRTGLTDTDRLVFVLPTHFADPRIAGIVVDLTVDSTPGAGGADRDALVARMMKEVNAASAGAAAKLAQAPASPEDLLMAATLNAFADAGEAPRGTLLYLTQQSGAKLTESVALVADDRLLALITGGIRSKIPRLPSRDAKTVGWMIDSTTIKTLASVKEDDRGRSLPAVQGALGAYAGEAGRQLDLLAALADESVSSEDLQNRLIAEHIIALEDNSPAVRVRAYDWLKAGGRKAAPKGFDPLSPARARRDALNAYHENATTQPTTQAAVNP